MTEISGHLNFSSNNDDQNSAGKIAIVLSRFNSFIGEQLLKGAVDTLDRLGFPSENIIVTRVPGAFEIPLITKKLAAKEEVMGVIALGAVIRGSTPHFDYVANECAKGLSSIALHTDTPVMFGVLTTDTIEQAVERAGTKAGNKGADAAIALIETINLLAKL